MFVAVKRNSDSVRSWETPLTSLIRLTRLHCGWTCNTLASPCVYCWKSSETLQTSGAYLLWSHSRVLVQSIVRKIDARVERSRRRVFEQFCLMTHSQPCSCINQSMYLYIYRTIPWITTTHTIVMSLLLYPWECQLDSSLYPIYKPSIPPIARVLHRQKHLRVKSKLSQQLCNRCAFCRHDAPKEFYRQHLLNIAIYPGVDGISLHKLRNVCALIGISYERTHDLSLVSNYKYMCLLIS